MCGVLMSIKPEYVQRILAGKKEYEFRKRVCRKNIDKIYIYSTNPVQKVVGEAEVESILVASPEEIWRRTKEKAGIDKHFFDRYYKGKEAAVAYKLINVIKYEKPRTLDELGVKTAPQSYQYVYKRG